MKTSLRLDSISPNLADSYRRANDCKRRRAALATCVVAVEKTRLQGGEVEAAIELLRNEQYDQLDIRRKLNDLIVKLDAQYLGLNNEAEVTAPEALLAFRRARAAAALAFALSADPGELHESLYEAIVASGDQVEAMRAADAALSKGN